MTKLSFPHAIIFDLDGTLIDSAPDLHNVINQFLTSKNRRNLNLREVRSLIGWGVPRFVESAFSLTGDTPKGAELRILIDHFLAMYSEQLSEMTKLFPGTSNMLKQFVERGVRLSVCTNKPYLPAKKVLAQLGISNFFDAVIGGDSLNGIRKPDARHLLAALAPLKVDKKLALVVGDSQNDILGAKNAGLKSVVVSFGYSNTPVSSLGAEWIISDFSELMEIFRDTSLFK